MVLEPVEDFQTEVDAKVGREIRQAGDPL